MKTGSVRVVATGDHAKSRATPPQPFGCFEQLAEHCPAFGGGQVFSGECESAAGVQEVRQIEPIDAVHDGPFDERFNLSGVQACHRHPNAHPHTGRLGVRHAECRTLEPPLHAAVGVVERRQAVQTDADV